MTPARHRAWRFVHPDLDAPGERPGLGVAPSGGVAMVEGDAAVRQGLLLLLSTVPGERVMRPDYGCEIHRLVFSPNDATTAGLAIHYVRRAITRWEPRVLLLDVDAARHPEAPDRLDVVVRYRVRASGRTSTLTLSTHLMGGPA